MIVADSSVLIEVVRGSLRAKRLLASHDAVLAPALVAYELWNGATTARSQHAVRQLLDLCQVEAFSAALAEGASTLRRALTASGARRPAIDTMIAAHAIHHGAPLATLDRDYSGIPGLRVVHP